jgi:hypothetical protein
METVALPVLPLHLSEAVAIGIAPSMLAAVLTGAVLHWLVQKV